MSSPGNHNKGARYGYARGGKTPISSHKRSDHGSDRNPISKQKRSERLGGHCYHVPIPKKIRGGVVAGKNRSNFRRIEEGLLPHIVHLSLLQTDTVVQVELETTDEELFQRVEETLKHLFATIYIQNYAINQVRLREVAGSRSGVASAWFEKYEDVLVEHLSRYQESTYVLCCDESRVDESASLEHPGEEGKYFSVEWVTNKLQDALKGLQSEQRRNPNLQGTLEVILGRKIWHSLPDEVLKNNQRMSLAELLDIGSKCQCAMNISVNASKVNMVSKELKDSCVPWPSVETFNFSLTLPNKDSDKRKRVDVQVMAMECGEMKITRVNKNDDRSRVIAFDVMCLYRQHDFRLELDCHEIIPTCDPEFIVIKKFVESISQTPGTLTFTPCDGWKVNMFRYKRQSTFLYPGTHHDTDADPDTFMVTMSDVKECSVAWENYGRRNEGEQLTVNLEDLASHWELELRNILWECAFAKDVGQAPEEALAPYMEHPSVDPIVKARVPHPWDPEIFISQDLHSILDIVDWLSDQLN